jgi:hypothetical protein
LQLYPLRNSNRTLSLSLSLSLLYRAYCKFSVKKTVSKHCVNLHKYYWPTWIMHMPENIYKLPKSELNDNHKSQP